MIELDNFLLIVLISGLIFGASNGIIYRSGYSTGGMDILIEILSKYLKIPRGTASFILNFIVIFSGSFFFGLSKTVYAIIIIDPEAFIIISDCYEVYGGQRKEQFPFI